MPKSIYPCLWFDGQAKAAAEFYCSIFPNSRISTDTGMVVLFEIDGKPMMGLNGGPMFVINPSISMFVQRKSADECHRIWNSLSDGAKILMDLNSYPWSELYGWIQDKFGFTWQIMKSSTDKTMPSLLFTGEQFGKANEAMDFYTRTFPQSGIDNKNIYPEGAPFAGTVAYAEFNLNQYPLVAMDGPNEHKFNFSEAVSFVVNCETQEEIDHYWDQFTQDGGKESRCGWCADKYGVSWQIIPAAIGKLMSDPEKGKRVMQAILQMKKIDLAILMQA
jgi:predicted 3-demethylubiquinone-9 3-methyltransferase (glyoxalase superfamily)